MRITKIMQNQEKRGKPPTLSGVLAVSALCVMAVPTVMIQFSYAQSVIASAPTFTYSPLEGRISSRYGERENPFTKKIQFHRGIDIPAATGTPIVAPGPGKVIRVLEKYKGYGSFLEIDHGGTIVTRYGQLSAFDVKVGDTVKAGQIIARVGASGRATGPHLHLEVFKNGGSVDPESILPLKNRR